MNHLHILRLAALVGARKRDRRTYFIGAIGFRKDGTIVTAYNGNPERPSPLHHCEKRLCRKLDKGSVVYVGRSIADGTMTCARPCQRCMLALYKSGVKRVYWSGWVGYGTHIF